MLSENELTLAPKPLAQQMQQRKQRNRRPNTGTQNRPVASRSGQQSTLDQSQSPGNTTATVISGKKTPRKETKGAAGNQVRRSTNTLKMIPLGGMREIGKNMVIFEYGQDMIIVDCGISFPDENMPGIDVVIPDFSYVRDNIDRLRGIFLTHGHEDHIGALPWLCKDTHTPIYGNHLTLALVRQKLEDRGTGVKGVTLIDVSDGERKTAGCFEVEFIHVNHSIADANALAIRTPAGTIFYSGDFKIDYTPINGTPMNLSRIAEIGAEGVLLMVCESTNIERAGHSSSESKVGEALIELFQQAPGRIFVTTFSSNVFRIQQIITAAERYQRKVVLIGRSMLNYFAAADSLGYLNYKMDTLIDVNQVGKFDSDQLVFITTGSQGEPLSALTRMAYAEHRQIEIVPGDTVILSSSAIPGNEKPIYRVINELYKRGARVIYESLSEIHVSGHGYQEELKILHNLVHPRYFIPGHGEYRHLYRHAELANQLGISFENIFILNNGDIFEFQPQKNSALISGFVQAPGVLIDGSGIGDIDQLVLRDRLLLAEDGVIAVAIAINRQTGEMNGLPSIQARGFIYESESTRIVKDCQKKIADMIRKAALSDRSLSDLLRSDAISDQLQQLLYSRTKRRPMILISVIDI